jgi:signal transduction histidine kinase
MSSRKRYIIWFIVVSNLLIAYLQLSVIPEIQALHHVYTELHYIPLLVGAVAFGMRGAVLTFLLTTTFYLTYVFASWTGAPVSIVETSVHLLVSGAFAVLAGFLVDREKRQRQQLKRQRSLAGLGQAVAAVVHDLKNPVITILAFVRRVREGKGDLETAMKMINDSAQNMERAVRGILDFAKPINVTAEKQDVRGLVERVCELCRAKAEEGGVRLIKDLPVKPVVVAMDAFCMERALTNLVNNAIEASNKGQSVEIRVLTDSEKAAIMITDHGQGMDGETLENTFTPFYSKKSAGTGLGMAVAKKIIEEHEGEIAIISELGVGTEITVTLPCGPPGTLQMEEQQKSSSRLGSPPSAVVPRYRQNGWH